MSDQNISHIKYAQPFSFSAGNHGVLLIHGFTGSPAHMRPIGEKLHQSGFTVEGIRLLGHGTTLMDMKDISWKQWVEQVEEAYLKLKEKCDCVSVAGLSMGGVLALALSEKYPVTAVITYSAPTEVKNPFAKWAKKLSKVYPKVKSRPPKERALELKAEYDIGYEGFPTQSVGELLKLINHTKENLNKVVSPLLVFQSHGDKTISKTSGEEILNGVSSLSKKLVWLNEVPHVITISKEEENIARQTIVFLRANEIS